MAGAQSVHANICDSGKLHLRYCTPYISRKFAKIKSPQAKGQPKSNIHPEPIAGKILQYFWVSTFPQPSRHREPECLTMI